VQIQALRLAYLPTKESYQLSVKLILNGKSPNGLNPSKEEEEEEEEKEEEEATYEYLNIAYVPTLPYRQHTSSV
jgi:protein involved in sex pheromone biosynthesis